jgi:hypothetical protein
MLNPKWYLKSKAVQRQHPNLLERFLDFGKFKGLDVEQKATNFVILSSPKPQKL